MCLGLVLFGLGEGLLIVSFAGASPWSILAQGIALNVDLSTGIITIFVSIGVLLLWLPLKQKPGIGTILNAIIIGLMIDICIKFVPTPENYISQILFSCIDLEAHLVMLYQKVKGLLAELLLLLNIHLFGTVLKDSRK